MKTLWNKLKDTVITGFPIIAIVVGMILMIIGYFVIQKTDASEDNLRTFIIVLGQTMTVGGFFAAVVKSFQYLGVFREEISKIVFGEDFLRRRNDLRDLWKNVTKAMCNQKFPELDLTIHENVIDEYLPTKKEYYYSKFHRILTIEWHDRANKIISIEETLEAEIKTSDKEKGVSYTFWSQYLDDPDIMEFQIEELNIDGEEYKNKGKEGKVMDKRGRGCVKNTYNIKLAGKHVYTVFRRTIRKMNISEDPTSACTCDTFALDTQVHVFCRAKGLKVEFTELGTINEFKPVIPKAPPAKVLRPAPVNAVDTDIHLEYPGMIFPQQGYVLIPSGAVRDS